MHWEANDVCGVRAWGIRGPKDKISQRPTISSLTKGRVLQSRKKSLVDSTFETGKSTERRIFARQAGIDLCISSLYPSTIAQVGEKLCLRGSPLFMPGNPFKEGAMHVERCAAVENSGCKTKHVEIRVFSLG